MILGQNNLIDKISHIIDIVKEEMLFICILEPIKANLH